MLRTILLLDGSEAMNNASDYVPSYLLALRSPLLSYVVAHLDSSPLASLGVVVMRDGISRRLAPCTANVSEVIGAMERDYFLYGGSGATSLENGLRMALSELVDLKRATAGGNINGKTQGGAKRAVRLRVLLVSGAVTLIDPTDVFAVIRTLAVFHVEVNVVSLAGSVHVFEESARLTGGAFLTPLNYNHLQRMLHQLAVGDAELRRYHYRRTVNGKDEDEDGDDAPVMIPIGFPVYLRRTGAENEEEEYFLACPQCHLVQTVIPSTCSLCKLLLCSAPALYGNFIMHNHLIPPTIPNAAASAAAAHPGRAEDAGQPIGRPAPSPPAVSSSCPVRCNLCQAPLGSADAAYQCQGCGGWECEACSVMVREVMGLCPICTALV